MTYVPSTFYDKGERRPDRVPIVFGLMNPLGDIISDFMLTCQVNPSSFDERMTKKIERIQTKGGWVEQHWGEEMDEISASQSTGAFINVQSGLTGEAYYQRNTIAFDKFKDLLELYRNNGNVYDSTGDTIFQGSVVINYATAERIEKHYIGRFNNFTYNITVDKPWLYELTWTFKVHSGLEYVSHYSAGL